MCRILAVDDDKGILAVIRKALEKEGYLVDTLDDPEKIDPERLSGYQLILLDVMMPGTDGFTVCRRIREQVDCPIIFVTAKTEEGDLITGFGLGADDYIRKPFGLGELRARVAAHLRRENREKKHRITLGDLEFSLQAKEIYCQGKQIPLTKSEYSICEYLALNRGQVFSKERIYEHVFGYDGESDSSTITEHIKNIRAKLQKVGVSPVETVWGIGYKWK
ncbi:MAG: response regulator transcription factor [Blautia sp.]|uniref:response regulator transcription factor n=1 Tax=Blautia sp. TaxID=1955243 RepID=UPI002A755B1A|nr:response regulator transcription factor [Blautia sp.]MDY3017950.1 response regulator transcription factor [Blautia sp.]